MDLEYQTEYDLYEILWRKWNEHEDGWDGNMANSNRLKRVAIFGYVTCLRSKLSVIHGSSMGFADFDSIPRPSTSRNPKNPSFPLNMAWREIDSRKHHNCCYSIYHMGFTWVLLQIHHVSCFLDIQYIQYMYIPILGIVDQHNEKVTIRMCTCWPLHWNRLRAMVVREVAGDNFKCHTLVKTKIGTATCWP